MLAGFGLKVLNQNLVFFGELSVLVKRALKLKPQ